MDRTNMALIVALAFGTMTTAHVRDIYAHIESGEATGGGAGRADATGEIDSARDKSGEAGAKSGEKPVTPEAKGGKCYECENCKKCKKKCKQNECEKCKGPDCKEKCKGCNNCKSCKNRCKACQDKRPLKHR